MDLSGRGICLLGHEIEVHQSAIQVIDHLALRGSLGEQYGRSAAERLGVEPVWRNERHDVLEHRLLATVIGNWSFHVNVVVLSFSGIKNRCRHTVGILSLSWCVCTFIIAALPENLAAWRQGLFIAPL